MNEALDQDHPDPFVCASLLCILTKYSQIVRAQSNPEDVKPILTLDPSSRLPTSFIDALHPKPSSSTAPTTPLSYSAQVAEQFSSSYRQTPSQERGRLQFNNGAPSFASTAPDLLMDRRGLLGRRKGKMRGASSLSRSTLPP